MYRQRILEEKKRLNLSARTMSDLSRLHIMEETISRFLSGKTADPGVNTVLDLAETVGLKPYEAFMDSTLAAEFRAFLELKSKSEETEAERVRMLAEIDNLKKINAGLADKLRVLEMELSHKEELLSVYEHFTGIKTTNKQERG